MLISWTHLLDRLERIGDSHSRVEIQQLRGLARLADDETGFPPLRAEELGPDTPRRLLGLQRLVDNATERAVHDGYASIESLKITPLRRGYGRYLYLKGTGGAWFGIDFDRWARGSYPDTPIWLYFEQWGGKQNRELWPKTRSALTSSLGRIDPPECFEEDHAILVPVSLQTEVEYDELLEAVVKRLGDVAHLISLEGPDTA